MNTRILDLLSSPSNIESADIPIISKAIEMYPYVQSIRALHLLGVSKFSPEAYSKTLATVAAFTTDKKILYTLVNGKMSTHLSQEEKTAEPIEENEVQEEEISITEETVEMENKEEKESNSSIQQESQEKDIEEQEPELNYHENTETEYHHPAVKHSEHFVPKTSTHTDKNPELERQKLIEEVERRLKEKKKNQPQKIKIEEETPEEMMGDINFSESEMELIKEEENPSQHQEEIPPKEEKPAPSNIPTFLSTWSNWLKIDHTAVKTFTSKPKKQEEKPKVEEIKAQAIEKFIANEPKISRPKDESTFTVVKERKDDDISHLMTETLANIYVEQRLYTKAIQAYEILTEKHPEKTQLYADKIEELKDMKNPNFG